MITHITIGDLDQDRLSNMIAWDGVNQSVRWLRQAPRGVFTKRQIETAIPDPVYAGLCAINRTRHTGWLNSATRRVVW